MRHRWLLLPSLLVSASGVLQAQSTDSALVRRASANLDSVGTALTRYCNTSSARGYVCDAKVNLKTAKSSVDSIRPGRVDTVFIHDSSVVVTKPPVDSMKDTTSTQPPAPVGTTDLATLPQDSVTPIYPSGLTSVQVPVGANLQTALDNAPCNTELLLAPGATYTGNFTYKIHPCSGPIVIRSNLPRLPRGTRITPTLSASRQQAKIVTPNNLQAILVVPGAQGLWLEDLEFSCPNDITNACVWLGKTDATQNTLALVPSNLVLSHDYIHGSTTTNLSRCVYLNSQRSAVIDSWLAECHDINKDSQAILVLNGAGPFLIENNYLESGHEVVMFGGGGPAVPNLVPSDIIVRGNHITRPLAWKGKWRVKNLIESKNSRRVLIEGNVIENVWTDAQTGYAMVLKSVDQDSNAPWSTTNNWTVRYNLFRCIGAGVNIAANPEGAKVTDPAHHFTFYDNVFLGINVAPCNGEAREWQLLGGLHDLAITHNTSMGTGIATAISFDGQPPKITRVMFSSNIYDNGAYGLHGPGTTGVTALATAADTSQASWTFNVATGSKCSASAIPATNKCASSLSILGLDSLGVLSPTSTFALPSHDGQPIGAHTSAVYARVQKVVVAP